MARWAVGGKVLPIEPLLALLERAPAQLAELTAGLTPDQLRTAPAPSAWSANEVLAHLRACADVWGDSIQTILANDRPTIRAINPRTWITQTDYLELAFGRSLRAYARQRARLVATLRELPPEAWSRSATITGAGKALVRTVHYYSDSIAVHERPHIKQMARIAQALCQ